LVFVLPAGGLAGEGEGFAEVFGLKKEVLLWTGVDDAEGDGEGAGDEVVAAGVFFLCFFSAGAGEAAAAGEAALVAAGEALAATSAFLCDLCLAGEGDGEAVGVGDWAPSNPTMANEVIRKKAMSFVFMTRT
jgi:hypothetical protein